MKKYYYNNSVDTIFIMLGFSCNFNCLYCMQHEFKTDNVVNLSYNTDIIEFIKLYACKQPDDNPLRIIFFGGEPLLYFETLKDIILNLKDVNINYSIITNGSLLTDEIIEYLNSNNICVSVSWDGKTTKLSRLIDVFETNKENIFKLDNFYISSVLNAYNSPKSVLDDILNISNEYNALYDTNKFIGFNLDNLYDLGNCNKDVFNINFDKYREDILDIITRYINDQENCSETEFVYINNIIDMIKSYQEYDEESNNKQYSPCMNGIKVLNLDLQGNLYLCHNNLDKKLGTIYSSVDEYMEKYFTYNKNFKFYVENCVECPIRFCCDGGCMLLSEDEKKNYFCKQKKAMYLPIIESLIHYGEHHTSDNNLSDEV